MIRTLAASLAVALLLPSAAFAQSEFEGLDLTKDEAQKPADEKTGEQAAPPPSTPPPAAAATPTAADAAASNLGERDITQEDRVKSVQRKLYLKRGRFELAPSVATTLNDPFYSKFALALRAAFYPADTFAISLRGTLFQVQKTEDVKIAQRDFQSRIFYSVPIWSAMADAEWSPIYGKVSFMNSILHFDAYVLGGAGIVTTETSAAKDRGPAPATDLGLGARFVAKDFLAVNLALINTAYVDQPTGTTKGSVQNVQAIYLGLSLFIPFKSTYREEE